MKENKTINFKVINLDHYFHFVPAILDHVKKNPKISNNNVSRLVGKFEADALSYPFDAQCDFGYVHESKTCKNHAYWHEKAKEICDGKDKNLQKYGILAPCGTDVFTGVEYVCCAVSKTLASSWIFPICNTGSHI